MRSLTQAELQALRASLRDQWLKTAQQAGASAQQSEALWLDLLNRYGEAGRAYHNLSHIAALLAHAERCRASLKEPLVVAMAIWFHDVIYDTHASDNEERSAALAVAVLHGWGLDAPRIARVEACILATKKHALLGDGGANGADADQAYFLDMDLAILGVAPALYNQYSAAIREEYRWVPDPAYRAGRTAVLQKFLLRPRLYFTSQFADAYERQARTNLEQEVQRLGDQDESN
jgi:predicted metal-dependent HD superfamily phosphohydrolase